jgi:hypothetical protein
MGPQTLNFHVGDTEYQVGRLTACDGSWILTQLLTKMLPAMFETALARLAGGRLPPNRSLITEAEFQNIQSHCLAVCRRMENGAPMPVFVPPNTWAIKELEYDLVTVMVLTIQALVFNIQPFFEGGGLTQILGLLSIQGLNSSASPT